MMKAKILVPFMLFLIGCGDTDSAQAISSKASRPSCLVEEKRTKEIILCFEGKLEYVKRKCGTQDKRGNHIEIKKYPEVTFSETKGCPRDQGYVGYCIMDGGSYIPYSYIDPSLKISKSNKNMMKEMYKKDCLDLRGEWME